MSKIHPTAIIEDGARLGEECQIGAYACVGPHVTLGNRCILQSHAVIDGHTSLGDECEVFSFACLGKKTQDLKYKGGVARVEIGSRNAIREYVTIHAATEDGGVTHIGSDCLIQAYCHIAHECTLGDGIIMTSGAMLAGHVQIGDHAVIMGNAGIVPFARVGTMGLVGGYSKLVQDVLPFCIADGNPAELRSINKVKMERLGRSREQIRVVGLAFRKIIRSGLSLEKAIEELRAEFPDSPDVSAMIEFALTSERGLARPRHHGDES